MGIQQPQYIREDIQSGKNRFSVPVLTGAEDRMSGASKLPGKKLHAVPFTAAAAAAAGEVEITADRTGFVGHSTLHGRHEVVAVASQSLCEQRLTRRI